MNQKTFLLRLRAGLQRLPAKDINEIVSDYEEFFRDGTAEGHTEEEIAARLGDPERIARELNARSQLQNWEKRKSFRSLWGVVMAYAGLGALNFVLAFPLLFWLLLLTCGFITAGSLLLAGLICTTLGVTQWAFGWPDSEKVVVSHKHQKNMASGSASIIIGDSGVEIIGNDAQAVKNAVDKASGSGSSVKIIADKKSGTALIDIQDKNGSVHISTSKLAVDSADDAADVAADKAEAAADKAAEAADREADKAEEAADKAAAAADNPGDKQAVKAAADAARAKAAAAHAVVEKVAAQREAEAKAQQAAAAADRAAANLNKSASAADDDEDGPEVVKKVLHIGNDGYDKKLLPIGLALLLSGGLGIVIAVLLARWTARLVSRFIRYQLDLLGVNKAEQTAS